MHVLIFLVDAVVSFFCTLFLLRFLMQVTRVSFAGQFGDFVVKLTNWAVKPLRRVIPGIGGMDWASLVAALALQILLTAPVVGLAGPPLAADGGAMALMALWFAVRTLLRQAVLSWINPHSPLAAPASQLTRPILDPIRRFVPLVAGIDLSPLVAILLLQAVLMFL